MLDLKFIRGNPKLVKETLKKKHQNSKLPLVSKLLKKEEQWRKLKQQADTLRAKRNSLSEEINKSKKAGKNIQSLIKEVKSLPAKINTLEEKTSNLKTEVHSLLSEIPNPLHKSVPTGKNHTENRVLKKYGKLPKFDFPVKNHVELGESLKVLDFEASASTSGNGFYYLKGKLALLNQALIRFVTDFMQSKNYTYLEPPLMINKKVAAAAGDLEAFQNALYKIQDETLYLIPTSEHAILGMLTNKTLSEEHLPLKFFAYSMCFRKEIGSHGINEKGLWRTHQFNKVEQFIFCHPRDSHKYYLELRKNSEEIYKRLKLPFRILESCSADLADWKSKSEDLEAYRPTTKQYEEVGSLSNCTDYQARDLNIRFLTKKGEKGIIHTLNNTAIATSRALVAIMENYQTKDGEIKVPAHLQKYTGFKKIEKPSS